MWVNDAMATVFAPFLAGVGRVEPGAAQTIEEGSESASGE